MDAISKIDKCLKVSDLLVRSGSKTKKLSKSNKKVEFLAYS